MGGIFSPPWTGFAGVEPVIMIILNYQIMPNPLYEVLFGSQKVISAKIKKIFTLLAQTFFQNILLPPNSGRRNRSYRC